MATGDDIIGSIDQALWRVQSRSVNNITPFTYRDGLTYIDVLERIRSSVIDVITFTNSFGEEQDKIIAKLNETVTNFITEVEKTHSGWNKELDAKRTALESLIDDFKRRLIDAEFREVDGNYIEAPLKSPAGKRVTLTTKAWGDALKAQNTQFQADIQGKLDQQRRDFDNRFPAYYTKTEANDIFLEDPKLTEGVVIGSSNATIEASRWTETLCRELGLNPNVYAIGGGGFTSTTDNNFLTQLDNAKQGMSEDKRHRTKYLFVIDLLNDIRAQNSVSDKASTFFRLARQYFPNADIRVLPVIFNESSLNEYVQMARSCVSRTFEVVNAGKPYGAVVCEGSRGWVHWGDGQAKSWDQGPDNVHMTASGYTHVKELFQVWLKGGSSWFNPPAMALHPLSDGTVAKDYNYLTCERDRDWVYIQGTFKVGTNNVGYDGRLMSIPGWARPYDGVMSTIIGNDRTYKYLYVAKTGGIYAGDILSANQTYQVNMTYKIW